MRCSRSAGRWRFLPLIALLAIAALPDSGTAQTRELTESQRRLEEIRRERARLRTELEQIRSRVTDASRELRNLEGQVSTSAELLREMEFQISETQNQIEQTSQDLVEMQERLARQKQILNVRLATIYKRGPLHTPQVLLAAESFGDLLSRYKYLYLLARRDRSLVSEVHNLRNQLIVRERQLQREMAQLELLMEEKTREHAELAHIEGQRRRALSEFQARERTVRQRDQALAQDEQRLTALIAELERKRREAERLAAERREAERRRAAAAGRAPAAAPRAERGPTITAAGRGSLAWPLDGQLIYRFGRVVQPNGTAVRMNGVGIAATAGAPVRAVEAGTVMMAGPFEGYGPTVVISHGAGYYTLYLYLRDISVREGAEVTRGQVVGTVGGSERQDGSHIEFQLRAPGGEAVDPLIWLRPQAAR